MRTMKVSGRTYHVDQQAVRDAVEGELPEPIREHYVIVNGRRWPPKQVLALLTGLDRADFTTHQARSALTRLGFTASRARHSRSGQGPTPRQASASVPAAGGDQSASLAESLRPFIGQWVAISGDEVLVAAATPAEVAAWLARHGQRAQSMFRVPGSEDTIATAAPA